MKATLCDRCGERIYSDNDAQPGRSATRIYIDALRKERNPGWHEFHASCVTGMTINDILNGKPA